MILLPIIRTLLHSNRLHNAGNSFVCQISTQAFPLQFRATPALSSMPLKKKKKVDPAFLKAKEEKKKKRIEKEIKRLSKFQKELKPIWEFQTPASLKENPESRKRNVLISEEEAERRTILLKEWSKYKNNEFKKDMKELHRIMDAQKLALSELRLESEELYQAAVKIDETLLPLKFKGPTVTPPKKDYIFPDGAYKDVSKKWI